MERWRVDEALRLRDAGYTPVPVFGFKGFRCMCGDAMCASGGRHAVTYSPPAVEEWESQYDDGFNIGVRLGSVGKVVIIESESGVGEMFIKTSLQLPPAPSFAVGDGVHRYFMYSERISGVASAIIGPDVELLSGDILIGTVPPATRPRGIVRWMDGMSIWDISMPELPETVIRKAISH